jgi:hypothetical protein
MKNLQFVAKRFTVVLIFWALPGFAKKHGHFEQELSILLVSTIDGNS